MGVLGMGCGDAKTDETAASMGTATGLQTTETSAGQPSTEICNGIDDDLDGEVDEGLTLSTFFEDADGDGYGVTSNSVQACEAPEGYAGQSGDCDDGESSVYPGAWDGCDGLDNDCDGALDEEHRPDWILSTVSMGEVLEIDIATGATTQRTPLQGTLGTVLINTSDSLDANLLMVHEPGPNTLHEVDSCEGSSILLGAHGQGNLPGMAFGHDGNLYGMDVDADAIVRIDPNTLASQSLLSLGFNVDTTGMAYDCAEEKLWVADTEGEQIFWYDAKTNTTGGFVTSNVPFSAVGLEFDNKTRTLFASTGTELYRIDLATGDGTYLSSFNTITNVNDLVLLPPCP